MKQPTFLFIACLAIASCSADSALPVLSSQSYGAVTFGASITEAETKLQQLAEPKIRAKGCSYITFAQYPDIRFMVENEIVTRADAGATIANSAGFSAGKNSADLQKASPQIKLMPHKYEPNGHYLILTAPDGMSALVFEESGGLITKVRAGIKPSVEYVEGCG